MKVIALVDGEHYPSVTRWGLLSAWSGGYEVELALVVGGIEKLGADRRLDLGPGMTVEHAQGDGRAALASAIRRLRPEGILDLSDEPVLDYDRRMELIAVALSLGVPYVGPDFRFDPPVVEAPLPVPTLAVIGAGKRVAKTAVSGQAARVAAGLGTTPVVVAMGRGGPAAPEVAGPDDVTVEALVARAARGEHAASDFLEDALTSGVPTVGARRMGGGLAGRAFGTPLGAAARTAVQLGGDPVILEGSGAALPTVPWDAGILVVPAGIPTEHFGGYLGPLRILLSDLVVFIMGAGPSSGSENLSALYPLARRLGEGIRISVAELEPVALADVRGKDAYFCTTAHRGVAASLADGLEHTSGCRVRGISTSLGDRAALEADLAAAPPVDVLVTELKAAAVDVAASWAVARGTEVVFVDNRPRTAGGDGEVDELLAATIRLAGERGAARVAEGR